MKILPVKQLYPFEMDIAPQETITVEEIEYVRHPFLVSPIDEYRYILLEQSGEFYRLKKAGVKEVPVQIIPFDKIQIIQNKIGLYSCDKEDIERFLENYPNGFYSKTTSRTEKNEKKLSVRFVLDDDIINVDFHCTSDTGCPRPLNELFQFLHDNGGYRMMRDVASLSDSLMKIQRFSATMEIPSITANQLIDAVTNSHPYPPGIIKITADTRMLYVDFPMNVLKADIPVVEKEDFLRQLINLREDTEKTLFYQGRIYLFNR